MPHVRWHAHRPARPLHLLVVYCRVRAMLSLVFDRGFSLTPEGIRLLTPARTSMRVLFVTGILHFEQDAGRPFAVNLPDD